MKELKQKRCAVCKELYTPKRMGLKVTKTCSAACELDHAQSVGPANGKLKKDLWSIFSLHQKLVHSKDGENCNCYTCDKPIKIGSSDCHGGHCLSKSGNPNLYFDERATRPQCYKCNVHYGGMHYEFNERLKQEIGLQSWQEMYDNRKQVNKRDRHWYLSQIQYYKAEVKRLQELKK